MISNERTQQTRTQSHIPNNETRHHKEKGERPTVQSSDVFNGLPQDIANEVLYWVARGDISEGTLRSLACTSTQWNLRTKQFLGSMQYEDSRSINDRHKANLILKAFASTNKFEFTHRFYDTSRLERILAIQVRERSDDDGWQSVAVDWQAVISREILSKFRTFDGRSLTLYTQHCEKEIFRKMADIIDALPKTVLLRLHLDQFLDKGVHNILELFQNLRAMHRPMGISFRNSSIQKPRIRDFLLDQMQGKLWLTDVNFGLVLGNSALFLRKLAAVIPKIKYVKLVAINLDHLPESKDFKILVQALMERDKAKMPKLVVALNLEGDDYATHGEDSLSDELLDDELLEKGEACGLICTRHEAYSTDDPRSNFEKLRELLNSEPFERYEGARLDADEDWANYESDVELSYSDDSYENHNRTQNYIWGLSDTSSDEEVSSSDEFVAAVKIPESETRGKRKGKRNLCVVS